LLLGFPDTGPLVMLGPEGQICALEVLNIAINIANDIFIVVFISDLCQRMFKLHIMRIIWRRRRRKKRNNIDNRRLIPTNSELVARMFMIL
jgi:hypothetical protein